MMAWGWVGLDWVDLDKEREGNGNSRGKLDRNVDSGAKKGLGWGEIES